MPKNKVKYLLACMAVGTMLSGCQPVSDGSDGEEGGDGGPDTPIPTLEPVVVAEPGTSTVLDFGTSSGSSFTSAAINSPSSAIPAGGSAILSLNVVDSSDDSLYLGNSVLQFTSNCAAVGDAVLGNGDGVANTMGGTASIVYQAEGCAGVDGISVFAGEGDDTRLVASGTVTVLSQEYGSMNALDLEAPSVALKGYGTSGLAETAKVSFEVLDRQGRPIPDKEVRFTLTNDEGGIELTRAESFTDAQGKVSTFVKSGSVNTTVRVEATIDVTDSSGSDTGIDATTVSMPLSIQVGIADSKGISISASVLNPEGWSIDNNRSQVQIILNDIHNNPVPVGTRVNFVTTNGSVQASCGTDEDGICTVDFITANPRADAGRVEVYASTLGLDYFKDIDGDSRFDAGELYEPQGEPYVDRNGNGSFDGPSASYDGEFFLDVDGNGAYTVVDAGAPFKGTGCDSVTTASGHCGEMSRVSTGITLVMAGMGSASGIDYSLDGLFSPAIDSAALSGNLDLTAGNSIDFYVRVPGANGNILPAGTAISGACKDGTALEVLNDTVVPGGGFSDTELFAPWYTYVEVTGPEPPAAGEPSKVITDKCSMTFTAPSGAANMIRFTTSITVADS